MLKQLLLITAFGCLVSGCTKEEEKEPALKNCALKTITIGDQPGVLFNVQINGGRIVQLTSVTDPQTRMVYQFNSAGLLANREDFTNTDNLGANLVRTRWEYYYDNANNLLATIQFNQGYSAGVALGLRMAVIDSFRYSNGHVSEVRQYSPFNGNNIYQGKTEFTWANDDMTSLLQYHPNGQMSHSIYFTYDATKENNYDSLFKGFYIQAMFESGHALEGVRRSKHVLTSAVDQWAGGSAVTRNYTTTFLPNGVVKSVKEDSYGATNFIYQFGYSCE